ncbi:MAG: porin [Deltaproteobacteria bacterium]|nr:porin [Deltaproteobacteria bacterium]
MKKLIMAVMICSFATPAIAEDGVVVSGAVEIQYRSSDDYYDDNAPAEYPSIDHNGETGGDVIIPEELYLQVSKKIDEGVEVLLKLDGADMDRYDDNARDDSKYVEEAQIIFSELGLDGLSIVAGKDEMPFGQDYEQFLLNSETHKLEIDKVWGLHAIYNFKGLGSIAAAVFERDRIANTKVQDSYAAKATLDQLVKNLSVQVSMARIGKDVGAAPPGEKDESRLSGGAVFKWGDFTFHGERTIIIDHDHEKDYDLDVTQVGADFKLKDFLIKVRQEVIDDENPDPTEDRQELKLAGGVNYYFSDKTFVAAEIEFTKWDIADDSEEVLLGVKFLF